ncbi:rCG62017, isoform CRA_c [Rattus norvegicus]|uniref:RCG62017, isoform CRA_c n=1 Tax=Rattus norvegicus TaxID=10116 RepID=A6HAH4_RAT|nr:rCG62017, isoform CRA_c [Rattus norvegicus]
MAGRILRCMLGLVWSRGRHHVFVRRKRKARWDQQVAFLKLRSAGILRTGSWILSGEALMRNQDPVVDRLALMYSFFGYLRKPGWTVVATAVK